MDGLGILRAHIAHLSAGRMIPRKIAINAPERVRTAGAGPGGLWKRAQAVTDACLRCIRTRA